MMEIITFAIGYSMGLSSGNVATPATSKYVVFATEEQEALDSLNKAYTKMYTEPFEPSYFDKNGNLVVNTTKKNFFGNEKTIEHIVESVNLSRFKEESLLKVKVLTDGLNPIPQNIMLARYLGRSKLNKN